MITMLNKTFPTGNKLLMLNEQREIMRAAYYAFAGRDDDAERIRERLGYSAEQRAHDVDKVSR